MKIGRIELNSKTLTNKGFEKESDGSFVNWNQVELKYSEFKKITKVMLDKPINEFTPKISKVTVERIYIVWDDDWMTFFIQIENEKLLKEEIAKIYIKTDLEEGK